MGSFEGVERWFGRRPRAQQRARCPGKMPKGRAPVLKHKALVVLRENSLMEPRRKTGLQIRVTVIFSS